MAVAESCLAVADALTEFYVLIKAAGMADLANAKPIPVFPQFVALRDLIYDMTDAVLFEKQAPQEALDEAEVAAQELLDEWLAG